MIANREYTPVVGTTCFLSSFSNVVQYVNPTIDEMHIFFSQEGLRLDYDRKETTRIGDIRLIHDYQSVIQRFISEHSLSCSKRAVGDVADMKSFLGNHHNKLAPIILFVNSSDLPYARAYRTAAGRGHVLVVVKYEDELIVSDCAIPTVPTTAYCGPILPDVLLQAWRKENCLFMDLNEHDVGILSRISIDPAVEKETFRRNLSFQFVDKAEESNHAKLLRFANDLKLFPERYPVEELNANMKELSFQFQFEGLVYARRLISSYLQKSGVAYSSVDERIKEWQNAALLIVKTGFMPTKHNFAELSRRIEELIHRDTETIREIYKSL